MQVSLSSHKTEPTVIDVVACNTRQISNVIPQDLLVKVLEELKNMNRSNYKMEYRTYPLGIVDQSHPVTFSANHEVDLSQTPKFYEPITYEEAQTENIKKLMLTVVNRFGKELQLQGVQPINYGLTRHRLPKGEIVDDLSWHYDPSDTWAMVCMLSDPSQWQGGELLVGENAHGYRQYNKKGKGEPKEGTVKTIPYSQNGAILFQNDYLIHKPAPMSALNDLAERIVVIVSLGDRPTY